VTGDRVENMYMLPLLCPSHLFQLAMNLGMRPGEKRITLYFVILYFFLITISPSPLILSLSILFVTCLATGSDRREQ
jgi:hypothetical protein